MISFLKKIQIILISITLSLFVSACDAPVTHKNIIEPEAKNLELESLPLKGYRGILFTMTKDEVIRKFKCTEYELTIGCPFFDGKKEDMLWVTYNESGRMILMKRDLGYFNFDQAQTFIDIFKQKYSVAYEPSPASLNTYKIGLKDTLSFVFANGQIVFQVGRSFNKRNELMNIFIFPPDVGATFLENVKK
jgi:hypothetical protein